LMNWTLEKMEFLNENQLEAGGDQGRKTKSTGGSCDLLWSVARAATAQDEACRGTMVRCHVIVGSRY
jgi:hypothetical protein